MQPPLRAEIHISCIQNGVLGGIEVKIQHCVSNVDTEPTESSVTIAPDKMFQRLEDVIRRSLVITCNKMETYLSKQRKGN